MIYVEAINIIIPIIVTDFIQCIATKDLGTLHAIFFLELFMTLNIRFLWGEQSSHLK
ncbi:Uncharacterised protein [Segatella copri]|nr:Uncharacterised protein [Segatella copri]